MNERNEAGVSFKGNRVVKPTRGYGSVIVTGSGNGRPSLSTTFMAPEEIGVTFMVLTSISTARK